MSLAISIKKIKEVFGTEIEIAKKHLFEYYSDKGDSTDYLLAAGIKKMLVEDFALSTSAADVLLEGMMMETYKTSPAYSESLLFLHALLLVLKANNLTSLNSI